MLRNSLVNTPPGICLANSRRERTERGVYAASTWDNPCDLSEVPERQEVRTVKRPEGRAPASILVGTLNTYSASRRTTGAADSTHGLVRQGECCKLVGGTPTRAVETTAL